jgi:hypothetical protein
MDGTADFPQFPPRAVSGNQRDKEIMMAKKAKKADKKAAKKGK